MNSRRILNTVLTGLLVVIILTFILSQLFGFPPPIGYVSTDSMEPQLDPGDGYVGIPKPLAGEVSSGDVVTYRAQELQEGGLITHRVVEKTEEGYITKGDANPFTDQDGPEPPVPESNIVLVLVEINGQILVLPNIGDIAIFLRAGLSTLISGLGLSGVSATNPGAVVGVLGVGLLILNEAYNLASGSESRSIIRTVDRPVVDSRVLLLGLLLILSLPLLSTTVLPSGTDEMRIVSTTTAQPGYEDRVKAGTSQNGSMAIKNQLALPMVIVVEGNSDDLRIADQVLSAAPGETVGTEYRIWAAEEPGSQLRVRSVNFYFPVLPPSVIGALHDIHPLVALGTTTGLILSPVAILFYLLVGFRPIFIRDTAR